MRKASIAAGLVVAVVLTLAVVACSDGGSSDLPTATPGSDDRIVVEAPIDELDVLILESFPVQYNARIVSGLPSGCAEFNSAEITGRNGNEITIRVTNTVPADEDVACTAIYGTKESTVPLGTDFVSNQTYVVRVNDKSTEFTAQ